MRQALIVAVTIVAVTAMAGLSSRPAQAATNRTAESAPMLLAQNSGPNLFSLLQDIQRLREQVRRMRGEIESLHYQIKRNQESRQRMYQNLDERLAALENGGTATGADKEEIKQSYMAAFEKLRNGKYDAAISDFEAFVKKYPDDSSYGDNAWYWLGQARYVQGDLSGAMEALQTMTNRFPKSSKLPSALFRMGVIEQTEGKTDKARAMFQRIVSQYSDSESADMARQRLQDMGQ